MIFDKLENADLYYDIVPGMKQFIEFFNNNDLETFPACKLKLDGDDLFVMIQDIQGKEAKNCPFESHRDYIDIQVPMTGDETMGWKAQEDCQQVTQEYDEGRDMELYADAPTIQFTVPVGHFVVFFPSDGHQPGIAPTTQKYRKLIVKTRVR